MGLNTIKGTGNWGGAASDLNNNFASITAEIEKLKAANVKFKGYYTTELTLKAAHPSPIVGDNAWVGAEYPGTVYDVVNGQWHDTTVAPSVGTVNLSEYSKLSGNEEFTGIKKMARGLELKKGFVAYGQDTLLTGVGRYVAAYVSPTFGSRILSYDGVNYYDLVLGAYVNGKFGMTLKANGEVSFGHLKQELGDSETAVMSQAAVTKELTELENKYIFESTQFDSDLLSKGYYKSIMDVYLPDLDVSTNIYVLSGVQKTNKQLTLYVLNEEGTQITAYAFRENKTIGSYSICTNGSLPNSIIVIDFDKLSEDVSGVSLKYEYAKLNRYYLKENTYEKIKSFINSHLIRTIGDVFSSDIEQYDEDLRSKGYYDSIIDIYVPDLTVNYEYSYIITAIIVSDKQLSLYEVRSNGEQQVRYIFTETESFGSLSKCTNDSYPNSYIIIDFTKLTGDITGILSKYKYVLLDKYRLKERYSMIQEIVQSSSELTKISEPQYTFNDTIKVYPNLEGNYGNDGIFVENSSFRSVLVAVNPTENFNIIPHTVPQVNVMRIFTGTQDDLGNAIEIIQTPANKGTISIPYGATYIAITCGTFGFTDNSYLELHGIDNYGSLRDFQQTVRDKRKIVCIGSSTTDGGLLINKAFPKYMQDELGSAYEVVNVATSGNTSKQINAKIGADAVILQSDVTIPTSGEVTVPLIMSDGTEYITNRIYGALGISPVMLYGIEGTLSPVVSGSSNQWVFTRTNEGEEVLVKKGEPIYTNPSINYRNYIAVFQYGGNDEIPESQEQIDRLIENIEMGISWLFDKRYVVLSHHIKTTDECETQLLKIYGNRLINLRRIAIDYGLTWLGIEPSEEDNTAISEGKVPPSIMKEDGAHFKDEFQPKLATYIIKIMRGLGLVK